MALGGTIQAHPIIIAQDSLKFHPSSVGFSSSAFGQEEAVRPTKTAVFEVSPKPGHALRFEAAVMRHMKWAKEQNSNWRWDVLAISTGRAEDWKRPTKGAKVKRVARGRPLEHAIHRAQAGPEGRELALVGELVHEDVLQEKHAIGEVLRHNPDPSSDPSLATWSGTSSGRATNTSPRICNSLRRCWKQRRRTLIIRTSDT